MSIEDNVAGGKLADETMKILVQVSNDAPDAQRQRFWERLKELCHEKAHPRMQPSPIAKNTIAQIGDMLVPFGSAKGEKFSHASFGELEWVRSRLEEHQSLLRLLSIYLNNREIRAEQEQCQR